MTFKTIWKYPLEITDKQQILMPKGAELLSLQAQDGNPKIWVLVNPEQKETDKFDIYMYGTGHLIDGQAMKNRAFLGTFQHGPLVFHVFMEK